MKSAPWLDLKHELHEQEDRFFERGVERVLRLRFPSITQPPPQQKLDRLGIDLIARDDAGAIDVAVQCKGFAVTIPGPDQLRQAKASIEKFANSGLHARLFIFVHNRDGRAREFTSEVKKLLAGLVSSGRCNEVEFLDVNDLLNSCKAALRTRLTAGLRRVAEKKLREFRELFAVMGDPLMDVPATEHRLLLNPTGPANLDVVAPARRRNVRELLRSRSDSKFTLLVGNFGVGKSTAGLLAAASEQADEPTIIFAECAYFSYDRIGSGLSVLLEEALKAAGVFDDFPSNDHDMYRLASPLLREELGNRGQTLDAPHRYVFLLDGLDENRLYARPDGMAVLINSLADLRCPIVLTTRREHFVAIFEDMQTGRLIFGQRHGWKTPIRLFALEPWERDDITAFVGGCIAQLKTTGKDTEAAHLSEFLDLLGSGRESEFYGDLAAHPLFLRLILDEVAAHGVRRTGRAKLLLDWSLHKIERDIKSKARAAGQGWEFERGFANRMMQLMEEIAALMTAEANGETRLLESIGIDAVLGIASRYFPKDDDVLLKVALNSLLIPHRLLDNAGFTMHFVYRIFHEFFLACHAVRHGIAPQAPGTHVAEFMAELREENFANTETPPRPVF
jgi:hypothetical protein